MGWHREQFQRAGWDISRNKNFRYTQEQKLASGQPINQPETTDLGRELQWVGKCSYQLEMFTSMSENHLVNVEGDISMGESTSQSKRDT